MRKYFFGVIIGLTSVSAQSEPQCEQPMTVKVMGSFTVQEALNTTKPALPKIKACFQGLLKKDKTAAGRITVTSYIQRDGKVERVEICASKALDRKGLKQCVRRRMEKLIYPKGVTPAEVQFPIDLAPS